MFPLRSNTIEPAQQQHQQGTEKQDLHLQQHGVLG
jgi:hypothetical protein